MKPKVFVGLDVSKQKLDVAIRPQGRHFVINNNDQGIKQLVKRLVALKPQIIVLEASGGYELMVTAALAEAQLPGLAARYAALIAGRTGEAGELYAFVLHNEPGNADAQALLPEVSGHDPAAARPATGKSVSRSAARSSTAHVRGRAMWCSASLRAGFTRMGIRWRAGCSSTSFACASIRRWLKRRL